MTGIDMAGFLAKKVETIIGKPVENCAETGLTRDTIVPLLSPCRAGVQLGGKRTFKTAGKTKGVQVTTVFAVHSNNPSEEAAYAVNVLLHPAAVIPSHSSEAATEGGKPRAGSRTEDFARLVEGRKVHLSLSGRTMEFDGDAKCVAGC